MAQEVAEGKIDDEGYRGRTYRRSCASSYRRRPCCGGNMQGTPRARRRGGLVGERRAANRKPRPFNGLAKALAWAALVAGINDMSSSPSSATPPAPPNYSSTPSSTAAPPLRSSTDRSHPRPDLYSAGQTGQSRNRGPTTQDLRGVGFIGPGECVDNFLPKNPERACTTERERRTRAAHQRRALVDVDDRGSSR